MGIPLTDPRIKEVDFTYDDDILYSVRGTGTDRDKKIQRSNEAQSTYYTQFVQVENQIGLSWTPINRPSHAACTQVLVWVIVPDDSLEVYEWDGSNWTSVALFIFSIDDPPFFPIGDSYIAALNETDIAFWDNSNQELRTYRYTAPSTIAKVGSGLSVTNGGYIIALNSTTIVILSGTSVQTYTWNGSIWSVTGAAYTVTGANIPSGVALNSTDIAYIDKGTYDLRVLRWDVTALTWSQVGNVILNVITSGGSYECPIVALNERDIIISDLSNWDFIRYIWNGTDFTKDISMFPIYTPIYPFSANFQEFTALNGHDILMFVDDAINYYIYPFRIEYFYEWPHCIQDPDEWS